MRNIVIFGILIFSSLAMGCQKLATQEPATNPKVRPVETRVLELTDPPESELVTASVAAWKTEQIGFEVSGRIAKVREPKDLIEGRVDPFKSMNAETKTDSPEKTSMARLTAMYESIERQVPLEEGHPVAKIISDIEAMFDTNRPQSPLIEGDFVAKIESGKYELQEEIAISKMNRAIQDIFTALKEKDGLNPQKDAATAKRDFAKSEFDRIEKLDQVKAVSALEFERAKADSITAQGGLDEVVAQIEAKKSKIESLKLEVLQSYQSFRDAERNVADCTLYSSFRGEVAEIFVEQGSYVNSGARVATIQMMNPIKIELEVSAEVSLRLRDLSKIPIYLEQPEGRVLTDAFLYQIDPIADTQTRTFTVTLLFLNMKTPTEFAGPKGVPVTNRPWRVNYPFIPGAQEGKFYVPLEAIRRDQQGAFLWKFTKLKQGNDWSTGELLDVEKIRISTPDSRTSILPFLGKWVFQQVELRGDFDPDHDLIAGKLGFNSVNPEGLTGDTWNGTQVRIDPTSKWGGVWTLRPGDVVKVDLGNRAAEKGFFVPMDAIVRRNGKTYLFTIPSGSSSVVETPIFLVDDNAGPTSSLREIKPVGDSSSLAGLKYVTAGTQYLADGDEVEVINGANE